MEIRIRDPRNADEAECMARLAMRHKVECRQDYPSAWTAYDGSRYVAKTNKAGNVVVERAITEKREG